MKHVVLYSGGHSSALAAIETVRQHGAENVILLNHDINPRTEDADIKRFKQEVADYLRQHGERASKRSFWRDRID